MVCGGDYYDRDVIETTSSGGYSETSGKVFEKANKLHSALDPKRFSSGVLGCEEKHPIVVGIDVTGSMGEWTKVIYDKLPMFYGQIMMQGYLEDPSISFCAVGDAAADDAPIQVTEIWLEGGGGGGYKESYEMCAYMYAKKSVLASAEIPFFFITGDEMFYPKCKAGWIKEVFGDIESDDLDSTRIWDDLKRHFKGNVFLLKKPYWKEKTEGKIMKQWEDALGSDHVLTFQTPKAVVDVMLGVIAIVSKQRDWKGYEKDMKIRGQSQERIEEVEECLKLLVKNLSVYEEEDEEDDEDDEEEEGEGEDDGILTVEKILGKKKKSEED